MNHISSRLHVVNIASYCDDKVYIPQQSPEEALEHLVQSVETITNSARTGDKIEKRSLVLELHLEAPDKKRRQ